MRSASSTSGSSSSSHVAVEAQRARAEGHAAQALSKNIAAISCLTAGALGFMSFTIFGVPYGAPRLAAARKAAGDEEAAARRR